MQTNTAGAPMILETRDLFVCQVFSHAQGRGKAKILGKLLKTFYLFLVCFILSRSWDFFSVLVICIALSVPIWAKSYQMHINIHLYESLYFSIIGRQLNNYCHYSWWYVVLFFLWFWEGDKSGEEDGMTENSHPSLFFPLCDKYDYYHVLYCISVCDFIPKQRILS